MPTTLVAPHRCHHLTSSILLPSYDSGTTTARRTKLIFFLVCTLSSTCQAFRPLIIERSCPPHGTTTSIPTFQCSPVIPQPQQRQGCNSFLLRAVTTNENDDIEYDDDDDDDDENYSDVDDNDDDETDATTPTTPVSFADLGIHPSVLSAIRAQPNWIYPTPVQELAIPILLQQLYVQDDDKSETSRLLQTATTASTDDNKRRADAVWCEAPTGSGKTAAFAIPLLQNLMYNNKGRNNADSDNNSRGRITSLILCPTRELAVQIGTVIDQLASNLSLKGSTRSTRRIQSPTLPRSTTTTAAATYNNKMINTMVLHGGVPLKPQLSQLADCAGSNTQIDVLVATPGRLVDVLTYYAKEGGDSSAQDAALERRLLEALDSMKGGVGGGGKDASLSLEQLQKLGVDDLTGGASTTRIGGIDDGADGRADLVNLLEGIQFLVIDEADRLLGRPFQSELDEVLELLPSYTKKSTAVPSMDDDVNDEESGSVDHENSLSTWLFSATFPKTIDPRLDQVLTRLGAKSPIRIGCTHSDRVLSDDVPVSSSLRKKLDRSNKVASADSYQKVGTASTIQLRTIRLEKRDRTQALRRLLEDENGSDKWDRVMVFVSTRYAAEHVSQKLQRVGIKSNELHGKLDQEARSRRLEDLKRGKVRVLICTDVASRGIDISGLSAVVNYDLPRSTSDFVHRIGRTGRAGQKGTAVSFITPSNESHMDLIEERHLSTPPLREVLPGFEPNEQRWQVEADGSRTVVPGTLHSSKGLDHDRMFGGIKGHRKSKKDKLREAAVGKAEK
jgi:superfamily II DNA/RNA helicase